MTPINEDTFSIISHHLGKQVVKFRDNRNKFRKGFTVDVEGAAFGPETEAVGSIIISQMLRNGIEGLDKRGFTTFENLKISFQRYTLKLFDDFIKTSASDKKNLNAFFSILTAILENKSSLDVFLKRIIFFDKETGDWKEPGTWPNCGRGGRYGSILQGDGTLFVRARYGHTLNSGIKPGETSEPDQALPSDKSLVHGTTMEGFRAIMNSEGIYSGKANAVMMEQMPDELGYYVDYIQKGLHREALGGLKDPISVAARHLSSFKEGIVVLIETAERVQLEEAGVKMYTANPPAKMYQVVCDSEAGKMGILSVPLSALRRFHIFKIDGDERKFVESVRTVEEAENCFSGIQE